MDRSAARLTRLTENLARMGLKAEAVAADAGAWSDPRTFDAVLLDAPCSATGTFRRHPDVLWAAKPTDIGKLAVVQRQLLDAAAAKVKPGGLLVYCVCSLEPEEGEAQAASFLSRKDDFEMAAIQLGEGGAPAAALTDAGTLRLTPQLAGTHRRAGWFLRRPIPTARLIRRSASVQPSPARIALQSRLTVKDRP